MSVTLINSFAFGTTAPNITYNDTVQSATTSATSFTNTHNGGVRTGLWIVTVAYRKASSGTNSDPTSVTLAGTALTKMHGASLGVNGRQGVSIWISTTNITTDGTDDVVVSTSTSNDRCTTSLYKVGNILAPGTTIDRTSDTGAALNLNNNSATGGVVMVAVGANGDPTAFTWTGLTENSDVNPGGSAFQVSSASAAFSTSGTKTISATSGATESIGLIVSVS